MTTPLSQRERATATRRRSQGTALFLAVNVSVALGLLLGALTPVAETTLVPPPPTLFVPNMASICSEAPSIRYYDLIALRVQIVYNNWGDYDPQGRLFLPAPLLPGLLATAGIALPLNPLDLAVPLNKTSPLVQPYVVRAHLGDCVQFNLTNWLPEPVSLHVHGVVAPPSQGLDLGHNGNDTVPPGATRTFRVWIPPLATMEGAHILHSHADDRYHTRHGLFGALVAEPLGTSWFTPQGWPSSTGVEAIVTHPLLADFREYVVIYHDEVTLLNATDKPLPVVSPYGEYGPGTKAINLRTEPFMNRFRYVDELFARAQLPRPHDVSQAYGSYTYGDPANFIPRAYVGDPSKFRLVNVGPGQHHVHHLHGGGDRWRVSPVSDDTQFDEGLIKVPPPDQVRSRSERVDVQSMGPGESFNAEIEGGAGGVQQSVGDFLFHCHIVEHYVGGMWSFWRVYNTLRPELAELPDRAGKTALAVDSLGLLGRTLPNGTVLTKDNLPAWVEPQLPPRGVPSDNEASVWDWDRLDTPVGPLYLGEPESTHVWPNYHSPTPGVRPRLLFNPSNARLAYPLLTPHLGERPPFAPGHGPAPYLSPDMDANHPDGLCPTGARPLSYRIVAFGVNVRYYENLVDPEGQIFAHAQDVAAIRDGTKPATSLVLRANQGDCVDVLFTSDLPDPESKVNMHIHLVQFDVQGSDGVITGLNYETSVRPVQATATTLASPASPGDTTLAVADAAQLRVGTFIGVGLTMDHVEVRRVVALNGNEVTVDAPLASNHDAGEYVGAEFVRYRWYPDVELGIVYWHDHVHGLTSWRHGLFGSIVVEPAGSRWLDPKRLVADPAANLDVLDGHLIDIVNEADPTNRSRTFREFVVQVQENGPGPLLSSLNLRSAPFSIFERTAGPHPLSSIGNGDPATNLWRAYPGDPVVVRLLYAGQGTHDQTQTSRGVGTFAITGHRFPLEPHNPGSRPSDRISFGISSQHNLWLDCGAGSCGNRPGDYLYQLAQPDPFSRGAWGIFRVYDTMQSDLQPLPSHPSPQATALPTGSIRHYDLVALEATFAVNERAGLVETRKLFALASDAEAIQEGTLRPEPLVLRATEGETIEVTLANNLLTNVTLYASMVLTDPATSLGIPVGANPPAGSLVAPGQTRTFTWFADRAATAYLASYGDPKQDPLGGLYGALLVEPAGALFNPSTGTHSILQLSNGTQLPEHVLFYDSNDAFFEASVMPYTDFVEGVAHLNYRTEPLASRVSLDVDLPHDAGVFNSTRFGDPETPILTASVGQPLLIRALSGGGDQLVVHTVDGHGWLRDPDLVGSNRVDAITLGPGESSEAWIWAAGPAGPGDYWFGQHRGPFVEAGAWGILRISPA